MNEYKNIVRAIKEMPSIVKYIDIVKEKSTTLDSDLESINYILEHHSIELVYDFMPRFISLM